MTADLQELYQSIILDHNRRPRNYGPLDDATNTAQGRNPLCGDEVKIEVRIGNDVVEAVKFTASGCAVSKASASIMTKAVTGKTRDEVDVLFTRFHELVTGKHKPDDAESRALGEMAAFSGVARFPVRVKCASMPWHTLQAALKRNDPAAA